MASSDQSKSTQHSANEMLKCQPVKMGKISSQELLPRSVSLRSFTSAGSCSAAQVRHGGSSRSSGRSNRLRSASGRGSQRSGDARKQRRKALLIINVFMCLPSGRQLRPRSSQGTVSWFLSGISRYLIWIRLLSRQGASHHTMLRSSSEILQGRVQGASGRAKPDQDVLSPRPGGG